MEWRAEVLQYCTCRYFAFQIPASNQYRQSIHPSMITLNGYSLFFLANVSAGDSYSSWGSDGKAVCCPLSDILVFSLDTAPSSKPREM